jgi:hypothetical protein
MCVYLPLNGFLMLCCSGDPLYGENLYWGWSSDPNFCLKVSNIINGTKICNAKTTFGFVCAGLGGSGQLV